MNKKLPKGITKSRYKTKDGCVDKYRVKLQKRDKKFDKTFSDYSEAIKALESFQLGIPIKNEIILKNTDLFDNLKEISEELHKHRTLELYEIYLSSRGWQEFFNKIGKINNAEIFYTIKNSFAKYNLSIKKYKTVKIGQIAIDGFCENSTYNRSSVKRYIIKNGLIEYECSNCNLKPFWNGKKLSLQLEHMNGIPNDNRLENLTFLCPNCHSQTATFAGKSKFLKNKNGGNRIDVAKKYAETLGGMCLSEEYLGANNKLEWKCRNIEHPSWFTTYSKVISDKSWCPCCSRGKNQFNRK